MNLESIGKRDELISKLLSLPSDDTLYQLAVKEYKPKRSLTANAYAWALIGKLADELRSSKDEVYLMMLERYGQSELISVLEEVNLKHFVKYYKEVGDGVVNGKTFKHYRVYKGSSEFDTREMAIFIDGIVSECESVGISTMTEHELELLKGSWNNA